MKEVHTHYARDLFRQYTDFSCFVSHVCLDTKSLNVCGHATFATLQPFQYSQIQLLAKHEKQDFSPRLKKSKEHIIKVTCSIGK